MSDKPLFPYASVVDSANSALIGHNIQAMKSVGAETPPMFLDKINRIGRGIGVECDPASVRFDPEQTKSFLHHLYASLPLPVYIHLLISSFSVNAPVNLARVLFVCIAYDLGGSLLDRMKAVEGSRYTAERNAPITSRYFEPQAKGSLELGGADVGIDDGTIYHYLYQESGVTNTTRGLIRYALSFGGAYIEVLMPAVVV